MHSQDIQYLIFQNEISQYLQLCVEDPFLQIQSLIYCFEFSGLFHEHHSRMAEMGI